ncbi:helix-turn-helix domain-containing protein [Dyadobacter sp. CY345]|uniref:helix-turn-helix transcriptional regulator n=1 Tax=Dyadobacter sp. CY345 TaxID=2909335 RepID=UPI001F24F0B9|nr:helix-turn-helix transcriptional regulator [Dyadobacter sp. CY345]MCF2443629.1 helix-turn-helix domain-containing protein [Dyadobacter sp. CY345]
MNQTFGQNVRKTLKSKGITQAQLARLLNTSPQNITATLNQENPSFQKIKKVADVLGVKAEDLISNEFAFRKNEKENKSDTIKVHADEQSISNDGGIVKRIKQYIDYEGIRISAFEKEVGFSNGAFASQVRNNKTIGSDKLENILKRYPRISSEWLLTGEGDMLKGFEDGPKIEILKSDPSTSIVELGEVIGLQSNFYVVVSPLLEKKYFKKYIQNYNDNKFLTNLPRHAVSIEIEDVESDNFGPYRSFEVTDGEITGNVTDSISNGSIVTAVKIENNIVEFNLASLTYKHLVLVMKSGIFINANITAAFKESLTLVPPMTYSEFEQYGLLKQYGQFNMGDLIELYAVVAISKIM